jgi:hypothetical protein
MDQPSPLAAEGVPFVFDHFRLISIEEELDPYLGGRPWSPAADSRSSLRQSEMPLNGAVVEFTIP